MGTPKDTNTRQTDQSLTQTRPIQDKWIKCIAKGGNVAATALIAPNLVDEARRRHNLSSKEAIALGETMLSSLLLVSTCKVGERLSLSVKGDGFLQQAVADADPAGHVRGFLLTRKDSEALQAEDPERGPWQNGLLTVVRLKLEEKEPYTGTVPTVTGHLAKDVTFYLSQSEQIPSAVGLAVTARKDGSIDSAGAFLVQVMPGADEKEIALVEDNIHKLGKLAEQIAEHPDPTYLLGQVFNDMTFMLLDEKPLKFQCNCSKERVTSALRLLGKTELELMIAEDHGAEIKCDFCSTPYHFKEVELQSLL